MDLQAHGYVVGIAGLFYGTVGYGLSIFTCIFGAALRPFFPELTQLPPRKSPVVIPGSKVHRRRQHESSSKRTSPTRDSTTSTSGATREKIVGKKSASLQPPPVTDRLRRVSSLDSFDHRKPPTLVTPVITIDHVDRADDSSIGATKATTLPNSSEKPENKTKRRSLTIAHPPSLPNLPRLPGGEEARPTNTFRLPSLKPFWGGEKNKPKIHRCASSPQLNDFIVDDPATSDSKKASSQDDVRPVLSGKISKKLLRQEKSLEPVSSQSSSKFFSAFPKSIEKKRSQVLRTQPYEAPYFVPLPMPALSLDETGRSKGGKRSCTLPPEEVVRPSTAPQR